MLILNEQEILQSVNLDDVMDAVEEAYKVYIGKDFFMPDRLHVDNGQKTLLYMPCSAGGRLGTKYLTLFPENIPKGLPTIYGLMVLNDYETGKPLAILDGKLITALRTGAVGGVGMRNICPETTTSVGLVGAGVQGYYQLMYACHVRNVSSIYIYDKHQSGLDAFVKHVEGIVKEGTKIEVCTDVRSLLERSELVITATTSNNPVLPDDEALLKGKAYVGIGSYKPTMREFPPAMIKAADHIFIDMDFAKEESGDLSQPLEDGLLAEERILSFGDYLAHCAEKEKVKQGTVWFKSVGMALFDVVIADKIYKKALEQGIGTKVNF